METVPRDERTVLVVEDDQDVRAGMCQALREASFLTIEAGTGEEALEVLESVQPAVVVLGMRMPGISGLDVIRLLRLRPTTDALPILLVTGSGDRDTVLRALAAGADDFLAEPVRVDELVARLEAHLRTQLAWSHHVEAELRARAEVVGALGRLSLSSDPHDAAAAIVGELARSAGFDFVGVLHLASPGRFDLLATFARAGGIERAGPLAPEHGRYLVTRARDGPWVEAVGTAGSGPSLRGPWPSDLEFAAGAPIYAGLRVVGLLVTGIARVPGPSPARQARLLAEVIDYANIVSATAGPSIAQHGRASDTRARLHRALSARAFFPVFQPIVDLRDKQPVGYEALTRFSDGASPDIRFAEATIHGLGLDFETATMEAALRESEHLPDGTLLSVNASPALVLEPERLARVLATTDRPVVLELTEHAPIDDYNALRDAFRALGPRVRVAVDDAGAGYASLRHILELRPSFVKLDVSIVRGIETDPLRQGLVTGLVYFAARTGCELIAEGIESEAEASALRDLNIRYGQGNVLGRPERVA
jgi:EAL domain-containing protein (putative c-di-GMP-specific phosphodiesterase class I)/DNA-binding response OmpR family regulator